VLSFPLRAREILDQLRHTLRVVELVDAKVSLLFILGEYGDMIDDAPYIIEPLINKLKVRLIAKTHTQWFSGQSYFPLID